MNSLEEQIREIEDEIRKTPYNKATSKHIGRLKAKVAKIRDEAVARAMAPPEGGRATPSRNRETPPLSSLGSRLSVRARCSTVSPVRT